MLDRFLRWFWPQHYSETATCQQCVAVVSKTRMYHNKVYGWFCNEDEFEEEWLGRQI